MVRPVMRDVLDDHLNEGICRALDSPEVQCVQTTLPGGKMQVTASQCCFFGVLFMLNVKDNSVSSMRTDEISPCRCHAKTGYAVPRLRDQATSRSIASSRGQNVSSVGSRRWPPAQSARKGSFQPFTNSETHSFLARLTIVFSYPPTTDLVRPPYGAERPTLKMRTIN